MSWMERISCSSGADTDTDMDADTDIDTDQRNIHKRERRRYGGGGKCIESRENPKGSRNICDLPFDFIFADSYPLTSFPKKIHSRIFSNTFYYKNQGPQRIHTSIILSLSFDFRRNPLHFLLCYRCCFWFLDRFSSGVLFIGLKRGHGCCCCCWWWFWFFVKGNGGSWGSTSCTCC